MSAIATPETRNPHIVKTPMLAFLEGMHDLWLQEMRGALDPAREETAGIWLRWRAIEYLQAGFKRRFERERRAVFSLHGRLTGEQASHLWAGGELLAQVVNSLGYRVGLCQRGEEFSSLALTVMSALEYWCRQVEEALGGVRWGEVPPESRRLFELITYDEVVHGG
jgi:hypothetical protein